MATIHLTKELFIARITDFVSSPGEFRFLGARPAIIDFYADWCGPCKMFSPVFEEVSEVYAGKIDFYKINVEDEEELAALFNVRSIPTLVFIPVNGSPRIIQGAVGKSQLTEVIEDILLK